jgi:hypothetical protein
MGLMEYTHPEEAERIVDPCSRCRRAEGIWSVAWPDIPADAFYLLCGQCLWRKFHELPKGNIRAALVRRVFHGRVFGLSGFLARA